MPFKYLIESNSSPHKKPINRFIKFNLIKWLKTLVNWNLIFLQCEHFYLSLTLISFFLIHKSQQIMPIMIKKKAKSQIILFNFA